MSHMRAILGLGSNVGDRLTNLQAAVNFIDLRVGRVGTISSVWQTSPVYVINQDPFFNAVIDVDTTLTPADLLTACKEIEREVGRVMRNRWGPREIDIDVLAMVDDEGKIIQVNTPSLQLPHPRMGERRFVIEPLREVDASLIPNQLQKELLVRQKADVVRDAKLSVHRD